MKAIVAAVLAVCAASASAQTAGQSEKGFYAGLDGGKTFFKYEPNDTSLGVFGGYQFNSNFAVEAGYRKLGESTRNVFYAYGNDQYFPSQLRESVSAVSLSAIGYLPVNDKMKVFGRLGASSMKVKFGGFDDEKTKALVGIGATYSLAPNVDARIEYQRFNSATKNLSAGVSYKF